MSVIAGSAKGQRIKAPKGAQTRPTSDKVREAIFSTIGAKVSDANVLDLYAGSGALGIEALSRGAGSATFIDSSTTAIKTIKDNLAKTEFEKKAKIIRKASESFLKSTKTYQFDLIFIDAPYKMKLNNLVNNIKVALELLTKNGLLILEHSSSIEIGREITVEKTKKYGNTKVTYIKK